MKTKLSIIIPVYNVEKYLEICLDAVLRQSFQDFEVILVDDGSTDSSPALCDEAAKRDARIRVIHQKNRGLSAARNAGLDIAEGEWIGFIDSDDYPMPEMYEKLLDAAEENHADVALCNYFRVNEEDQKIEQSETQISKGVLNREKALRKALNVVFQIACNKVYRRQIFENLRYPTGKFNEDFFLVTEIYSRAQRVACVEDALYAYRVTSGSIMQKKKTLKNYDVVEASDKCFQFYLNNGMKDMLPACERATFNNLREIYYALDKKDRRAPETKAAKAIARREMKEMREQGCLPFKTLCRGIVFRICPTLYKLEWRIKQKDT